MSYQALYRVWRPQRFDDMVGQQVVTRTLKNAIITHQISHAYLFAGPRRVLGRLLRLRFSPRLLIATTLKMVNHVMNVILVKQLLMVN